MLSVRWRSRRGEYADLNARFMDIVSVVFYPFYPTRGTTGGSVQREVYLMSLWRRDALRPIEHPLLHFRDLRFVGDDPVYPEDLAPARLYDTGAALRFSRLEIDMSLNAVPSLWAARLGWGTNGCAVCKHSERTHGENTERTRR